MAETVKSFADLGAQFQQARIPELLKLFKSAQYVEAADLADKIQVPQETVTKHAGEFSYSYYRRALVRHSERATAAAISDLEKALSFPGVTETFRLLVRSRIVAIREIGSSPDVVNFDKAVADRFDHNISDGGLLAEFLIRHSLHQPQRLLQVPFVDGISSVSVYRWKADEHYGETWSKLIRQAKRGDASVLPCFGRLLAEHARKLKEFQSWMREIDLVVPVPANPQRAAERHVDIVSVVASSFVNRLGLPLRSDMLKRTLGARSREIERSSLSNSTRSTREKIPTCEVEQSFLLTTLLREVTRECLRRKIEGSWLSKGLPAHARSIGRARSSYIHFSENLSVPRHRILVVGFA